MELSQLPEEILLQILSNLSTIDLVHVCQASHSFYVIACEEYLWSQLCKRLYYRMYSYFAPKLANTKKRSKTRREWYALVRDAHAAAVNWRSGKHFTFAVNGSPAARVTSLLIDYETVLCGTDGEILVCSAVTGRQLPSVTFPGIPASLLCTPSSSGSRRLIVGGGDGTVSQFDLQTGSLLAQSTAHAYWVSHLSVIDNTLLTSDGSSMVVWDLDLMKTRVTQTITNEPRSALTVADARLIEGTPCIALAPALGSPSIQRWDMRAQLWHDSVALPLHTPQMLKMQDGLIIAAGQSGRVQLLRWDVNSGAILKKQQLDQLPSHTAVANVAMDSRKVVVSAYHRTAPNAIHSEDKSGPASALYCYDIDSATSSWSMEQDARVSMLALDEFKCAGLIGDSIKIWNFVWG